MEEIKIKIRSLAQNHRNELERQIQDRQAELLGDENAHLHLYKVLGIGADEGRLIDLYQNTGRFLYRHAGQFMEEAALLCLHHKFPAGDKKRVENRGGGSPKSFEIDFCHDKLAIELK